MARLEGKQLVATDLGRRITAHVLEHGHVVDFAGTVDAEHAEVEHRAGEHSWRQLTIDREAP